MEKRILKKGISLVLALCMMISLLPAVSFAAGEPITFYFGDVGSAGGNVGKLKEVDGIDYLPDESTTRQDDQTRRLVRGTTDGLIKITFKKKIWINDSVPEGQVVFTADLGENPAAGWYQIQFTGGNY
ncbi:MAG: hypothetical protein IJN09_06475, partial [Oscillospiraceae bacterium]|nr:hypothetical protein [Oscillospiraceae bacterium]